MIQVQSKDTTKSLVEQQNKVLLEAKKLIQQGLWIVPTCDKISLSKNDKNSRLSYSEFEKILKQKHGNGLGILTNTHTNYVSFDLDTKDATNSKLFERRLLFELDNFPDLKAKIKISQTPSGGFHLYLLTENKTQKKQFFGAFAWSEYSKEKRQKQTITGRSDGQYCCEFPTREYNWILDNDLQVLNEKDINNLFNIFSVLNEDKNRNERKANNLLRIKQKQLEKAKLQANYKNFETEITVWDDFNARNSVETILLKHNFSIVFCKYDKTYFLRPGSKSKSSGFVQNNLYLNFSDNAGLPQSESGNGRKFTAFDLVVHLEYNSDYSEATRELSKQGYGRSKVIESERITAKAVTKNYVLDSDKYISDVLRKKDLKTGLNIVIGGTGVGKTYFAATSFDKTIIVSRNITTLENYEKYNFKRFLMQDAKNDFSELQNGNKITVTYKSLKNLLNTFDTSDYVFVFDEYHLLTDSYSDVKTETNFAYDSLKKLQQSNIVILASANDTFLSDTEFVIQSKHVFKKDLKRFANVNYNASFDNLKDCITKRLGEKKKVLLYTNRKDDKQISMQLKEYFCNNSILFFDATTHHINLENLESDITVCTKAMQTGKDILNENIAAIIYSDDYDMKAATINQFWGRARTYESASYDLFFTFKSANDKYKSYDINNMYQSRLSIANSVIKASVNDTSLLHENNENYVCKKNNELVVNHFAIDNAIETIVSKYTIRNTTLLSEFLKRHGYESSINEYIDKKAEKQQENDVLSTSEQYVNEIELLHNDINVDYEFATSAKQRVQALLNIDFSEKKSLYYALEYDSTFKFTRFVNHLICEKRLTTNDKSFLNDYEKLEKAFSKLLTTCEILERLKELDFSDSCTRIARDVKRFKDLDTNDKKAQRNVLKMLKNYFNVDVEKVNNVKFFRCLKTEFLKNEQIKNLSDSELKQLLKVKKIEKANFLVKTSET